MMALPRRLLLLLGGVALLLGGGSCIAAVPEKTMGDFLSQATGTEPRTPIRMSFSPHQNTPSVPPARGPQDDLGTPSHSLRYLIWAVWEPGWTLPVSTSSAYVDDQLIGRYDTDTDQCVPQSSWIKEISHDDANFWARSTGWDLPSSLATDLMVLKDLFNQSRGTHTLQVFSGCELSGGNHTPSGFVKYGYDGRDFLSLDLATLTWTPMDAEAEPVKRKWDAEQNRAESWKFILQETCVEWLRTHLHYGKQALLRTDRPTIILKTNLILTNKKRTLTCLLYGFYPKEVEVAWRKDGKDWNLDTRTGGVLPNSDGTYHTWLSIDIDPEETYRYSCRLKHVTIGAELKPPYIIPGTPAAATPTKVGSSGESSRASWLLVVLAGAKVLFYVM